MFSRVILLLLIVRSGAVFAANIPPELRTGVAGHAFDHLGNIGNQSEAAVASGANIIYATGLGTWGYQGLPDSIQWKHEQRAAAEYIRGAKRQGIKLALGYICATSIVKLDTFDANWSPEFRAQFKTPPSAWLQQDRDGKALPSWYGGDYRPACMNNPDWRAYERAIVRATLEAGGDGVFFDNPTVHPQGCFCRFCMEKFAVFLSANTNGLSAQAIHLPVAELRELALSRPDDFRRYRSIIARDFFADMRASARGVKRNALITANNSLNSTGVLYSQIRTHGYSIYEMSKAEDFVVVEDQSSQPRALADGRVLEYGPTYKQLHAISHGKPVVAVTIADADYHTAPNLVRLAMAEAAANGASYLSWPTWPEKERARMCAAIRPQAELLRQQQKLLNDTQPRSDAVLFLPMRRWIETDRCRASELAAELTRANVQFAVMSEDDFTESRKSLPSALRAARVFVIESRAVLNERENRALENWQSAGGKLVAADKADWLKQVQLTISKPSLALSAPPTVRAVVRDQAGRTIVHLLNLNVQRLSSFEDKVSPAMNVRVTLRVPHKTVRSVRALTADAGGTSGPLHFTARRDGDCTIIETSLDRLEIATLLVCD